MAMPEKRRLSEMAADEIRRLIKEAGFRPGDKIYSENDLTKRLDVSRSSVREAIRILEVTGLVTVRHGKGVFLNDRQADRFEPFRKWIGEHEDSLFEQFEVRLLIEPEAAALAASKAEKKEITEMRGVLAAFVEAAEAGDVDTAVQRDSEFHTLVAQATRNRTIHVLMSTFGQRLTEGWVTSLHIPGRMNKTIAEHGRILTAIEERNPEVARKQMRRHLTKARNEIRSYLNDVETG